MREKKLAKVFYADLWGLRDEKYKNLFKNDVTTTQWQELKPVEPYYFLVPKDFTLVAQYEKFWTVTDVFKDWSEAVKTHRDYFVVGFERNEIIQKLRTFLGNLPDELVSHTLNLRDTGSWKLSKARQEVKDLKPEDNIFPYAYRIFDVRWICYESSLIDRHRKEIMKHIMNRENLGLNLTRRLRDPIWRHVFVTSLVTDKTLLSPKDNCYFFPLYLYEEEPVGAIHELSLQDTNQAERVPNFTSEFLQAIESSVGIEPTPEEIFYYIYAVLYSPTYRERYQEFLKIDFPRVPLPSDKKSFNSLNKLGKELVDLHLLKHTALDDHGIGFPESGSDTVEKIQYDEDSERAYFNKNQSFEGISKEVWEYRIGAYQVMDKYLKDRKGRKLSLEEINHYMKVAKAILLTIELQERIDDMYTANVD